MEQKSALEITLDNLITDHERFGLSEEEELIAEDLEQDLIEMQEEEEHNKKYI